MVAHDANQKDFYIATKALRGSYVFNIIFDGKRLCHCCVHLQKNYSVSDIETVPLSCVDRELTEQDKLLSLISEILKQYTALQYERRLEIRQCKKKNLNAGLSIVERETLSTVVSVEDDDEEGNIDDSY